MSTIHKMAPEVPVWTMEEAREVLAAVSLSGDGTLSTDVFYPSLSENKASSYPELCFKKQIVNDILAYIRNGATRKDASAAVGVPSLIVTLWYRKNYGNFRVACDRAEALNKIKHIVTVNKGDKTWNAAAWVLERKYRDEYGKDPATVINIKEMNSVVNSLVNIVSNRLGDQAPDVLEQIANDMRSVGLIENESSN